MVRTAGATETDAGDEGEATAWNTGFKRLLLKRTEALRSVEPKDVICYGFFLLVVYAGCYLAMGKTFLPGGNVWALIIIWLAAHIGGFIISLVGLHPLLGQLLAGVVIININAHALTGGLKRSWSSQIRSGALALIFLRSGLELDWEVFKKVGPVAVRLLLIPGICEAFVSGTVAYKIFHMPLMLGFTLGFILKAVGPAIVIQLMFDLQRRGRGINKGIPALVVAAASFDDLVAITFYTIFASIAIGGAGNNVAWNIAEGPVQLVFGVVGGLLAALLAAWTKVWDTRWKRAGIVFTLSLLMMYFLNHWGLTGGGALASLILGMAVSQMWNKGWPALLAKRPDPHYAHTAEHFVGVFWRLIAQPLLFGLAGSGINFHVTPGSTIPKAIAVVLSGWAVRAPITFLSVTGAGLTVRERLFVVAAWAPKATVQAALAMAPAALIAQAHRSAPYPQWGQEMFVTAIFAIIICASVGVIAVSFLAPRCLHKTPVNWNAQLQQRKSGLAPGYKTVAEGAQDRPALDDDRPPTPPPQPPGPAAPSQPAAATAAKSSHQALSPPGIKEPEIQPAGPSTPGTIAGAERLWGSGAQAPDPLYEAAVVRELDAVVAEHLVQLESLAASSQDPATAEHLRRLASQLRRRKVEEGQARGNDTESARTFFAVHDRTQPEPGLPITDPSRGLESGPGHPATGAGSTHINLADFPLRPQL